MKISSTMKRKLNILLANNYIKNYCLNGVAETFAYF